MLNIKLICVGKMRERFYIDAFEEYRKRLGAYCRLELIEPAEQRLPERPSQAEIDAALDREAGEIIPASQSSALWWAGPTACRIGSKNAPICA